MGEINCLGDSLTGAFVVHLRHLTTNIAFISNTEEKTIKIIQNKATFPFILTLWAYGCTEFISAIAFLFKQFSLWPVILSSVIRKNSFMNSWKPTDYGKVSLKWYNESKNKYFCLIFFCHLILTPIAQDMIMKLQTLVICSVGQLFVTDTSFFNVFLICLKKHYSLLEGNW